jgi:NADPH:quinone reductase-like Zn-dependent oxidoreductase
MAKLNQEDLRALGELIEAGKVTPVIDKRFSLSETAAAVSHIAGKHARGKVIVEVAPA